MKNAMIWALMAALPAAVLLGLAMLAMPVFHAQSLLQKPEQLSYAGAQDLSYSTKSRATPGLKVAKGATSQLVYSDWRGQALEATDGFSFSHSWSGDMPLGELEATVVKEPKIQLVEGEDPGKLVEIQDTLKQDYNINLKGDWTAAQAGALLATLKDLCDPVKTSTGIAKENCDLTSETEWKIIGDKIVDDLAQKGDQVEVAEAALKHASKRDGKVNGVDGKLKSSRLTFAVMRFVTNHGNKYPVVNQLLKRRFGSQLNVDIGFTKLTKETTLEDKERFSEFRPAEKLFMLEAWSLMPENMHKVDGLKYVTRRQQGLYHPLYGATTAVSWPTNLDQSYQEYMDYSFNQDGYTSRHLFIHEKTHFFWGRKWSDETKKQWEDAGKWKETARYSEDWITPRSTAFASDYGASNNPDEDIAECMAAYVLHPKLLQARAPRKRAFIRDNMVKGTQYFEAPEVTAKLVNEKPYYRYPAAVKSVAIDVSGGQDEDKNVKIRMVVDNGKGWHPASHAEVDLSGPSGGSKSIELYPEATDKDGKTQTLVFDGTFSKHATKGFWQASQIKVVDTLGQERWVRVNDYSWRLYLNNAQGTDWPPRYRKGTTNLKAKYVKDESTGSIYPQLTATIRYEQTGAPLSKEKNPIWMRLAAKKANPDGSLTAKEWEDFGASAWQYPQYKEGTCVQDDLSYRGTCTATWELSPGTPAGEYYVSMINLEDEASNKRQQFYTLQRDGWTCCGQVGHTPNDEAPVTVELSQCAAGDIPTEEKPCVTGDILPPELDRSSVKAEIEQDESDRKVGKATLKLSFKARDDKSGVGTIAYRIMDPQGFSHSGYVTHKSSSGPIFHGAADEWKVYSKDIDLPRGSPPGEWRVESIDIHDKAGNRKHHQLIELLVFEPSS